MNFRRVDARTLGVSLDETTTRADVEAIWQTFGGEALRARSGSSSPARPWRCRPRCGADQSS